MRKFIFLYLLIFLIFIAGAVLFLKDEKDRSQLAQVSEVFKSKKIVREPAVAGQFYPKDPKELSTIIDQYLDRVDPPESKGEILALILPHAGYQFSGQVSAYGFKKLIGEEIDTVILIGNSHHERFEGISIFPEGFYKTPLGEIEIDSELAQKIMAEDERIFFRKSAHQKEHSLEVELPFLQKVLKNFKILPIIFGNSSNHDYKILAKALVNNIQRKNVLLIASSDLSHYPSYSNAKYLDSKIIEAILTAQVENLEQTIHNLKQEQIPNLVTFACGIDAIKTVMMVAKELGANEVKLLNYANSGDIFAEFKPRVVGYATIGFFGERRGNLLNKNEQQKLLEIARISVETFVREGKIPEFEVENLALNQKLGAFVTLKKRGLLRGCIGRFSPTDIPLYQVVSQMAIAAATQDRRFYPVTEDELELLHYEISVLSEMKKIDDWKKIEVGKHGVQIKKGFKSGVFLPQVATENNWDLEKFLGELCFQKLGLSRNCWEQKDIELYIFTAQVFAE